MVLILIKNSFPASKATRLGIKGLVFETNKKAGADTIDRSRSSQH
jgi:hypothetical protein